MHRQELPNEPFTMIEKLAYRYLTKLTELPAKERDSFHLLNEKEIKRIRYEVYFTLFVAAVFGTLGVLALYLPQFYFPELFPNYTIGFPFTVGTYEIPVITIVYGVVLAYLEIYALMALNIRAVFKIAEVCGFPDKSDPDYDRHIESLMRVGLEKDDKSSATYGLNPLQGTSRLTLMVFLIISRLKATLSNYLAKVLVRRILGRYALRQIIDMMVGIPVFAFWNAYASYVVIHETKVRIMAPNLIRQLCVDLHAKYKDNIGFTDYLYDTLQYIAMSKRRYHHNHFLLAKNVLLVFNVPVKDAHPLSDDYLERIKAAPEEVKEGIVKLLLLGFIIDGNLSPKEKVLIRKLHQEKIIGYDVHSIKTWIRSFVNGKGLSGLVNV